MKVGGLITRRGQHCPPAAGRQAMTVAWVAMSELRQVDTLGLMVHAKGLRGSCWCIRPPTSET